MKTQTRRHNIKLQLYAKYPKRKEEKQTDATNKNKKEQPSLDLQKRKTYNTNKAENEKRNYEHLRDEILLFSNRSNRANKMLSQRQR